MTTSFYMPIRMKADDTPDTLLNLTARGVAGSARLNGLIIFDTEDEVCNFLREQPNDIRADAVYVRFDAAVVTPEEGTTND